MAGIEQNVAVHEKMEDEERNEFTKAKEELEAWKVRVEQADDTKSRLIVRKLEEDQEKKKTNKLMMELIKKQETQLDEFTTNSQSVQDQILQIGKRKMDLMEKLKSCRAQLDLKRAESKKLQQKFKICARLPDTEVEFVKQKQDGPASSKDEPIRGQFSVCQQGALLLKGGQALITFEEEKVVSQILTMDKCSVSFDNNTLEVKPKRIRTDPVIQFEVHLDVSRTDLDVSEVVSMLPQERVRDRLELSFSRPSRGGSEVDSVQFNECEGTGRVSFLRPGVAESLALRGEHTVDLEAESVVKVTPVYQHHLQKFQSFCGAPKRTLLLDNIRDTGDEEEVQDQLEIHFQKPSNGGGEIEASRYISNGKTLLAYFCPDA